MGERMSIDPRDGKVDLALRTEVPLFLQEP
jgi:hypothetical protein